MLDHFLSFEGEPKKVNNKIVEYDLYLIAHNGSGFDRYVVINNFPQWPSVVNLIKNRAGLVSLKIFNRYVDQNGKTLSMYILDVEEFILIRVSKKIGENYKLPESLLKKELGHDEIYEDTWEARENEWLPYVKNDVLSTVFCYAKYTTGMEKITGFGM